MAEKKNDTVVCGCKGSDEGRCEAIVVGTPNFWSEDGNRLPLASSEHYHNHLVWLKAKKVATQSKSRTPN